MTLVYRHNCLSEPLAPPLALDRRRRRLSGVVARHAPKDRPFIVSVHRRGEVLKPQDHTVRLPARHPDYDGPLWREILVGPNDVVLITELPMGGGAGGQSSGKQIGTALAMIALVIVASVVAGPIAGTFFAAGTYALTAATAAVQAGIIVGGSMLLSLAAKPKANNDKDRPVYGVSGGGNLPRPGDRIPRLYGKAWTKPDLTQAPYTVYDGEDQILYQRMTLGLGKYQIHKIQIGVATFWTEGGGLQVPFTSVPGGGAFGQIGWGGPSGDTAYGSGGGCAMEIIAPGGASALVPATVYSSPSVGGTEITRSTANPAWTGPFAVCPVGKVTSRIQLDYSFPSGVFKTDDKSRQRATGYGVLFEIAPCDNADIPTGAWTQLLLDSQSIKSTRAIRKTRIIDFASGRYVVRSQNTATEEAGPNPEDDKYTNNVTWDGLRAHFPETITRPHVTEIALKIRSGKELGITAFGDVWVEATSVVPTWNGSAWVDAATRKAVYHYKDILQSTYGGNLLDSEVDLETIKARATALSAYDTFDGVIRGPVPVYEAASTVLGVMRAEPVRVGNVWSINRDEAKSIRKHKFTRRQIVRGSTSIDFDIDRSRGECDIIVEFSPEGDPRRRREARVTYGAASLTPHRVAATGISEWQHANRHATWLAAAAFYRREHHTVTVELQGRLVQRGELASIDSWFVADGTAAGVMSRAGFIVSLDTDVSVPANTYAVFRDRTGRDWGPVLVTAGVAANRIVVDAADAAAAEAASGVTFAAMFNLDAEDMTSVVVGPLLTERFIVDSLTPQGGSRVLLEAVLDADDVYTALGEAAPAVPTIPSRGDELEPDVAVIPWVRARAVQKATSLEMEWAVGRARGAARYTIQLSYDDGTTWEQVSDGVDVSGGHPLRHDSDDEISIKVGAFATSKVGNPGPTVYTTLTTFKPTLDSSNVVIDFDAFSDTARAGHAWISETLADIRAQIDRVNALVAEQDAHNLIGRIVDKETVQLTSGSLSASINIVKTVALSTEFAFAQYQIDVDARLGEAEADIILTADALVLLDAAYTSFVTKIESKYGTTNAFVDNTAATVAKVDGTAGALWVLTLGVGDVIGGVKLGNDGSTISAIWETTIFAIKGPSSNIVPFLVDVPNDRIVMNTTVFAQRIIANSIDTLELVVDGVRFENILAGSATDTVLAYHGAAVTGVDTEIDVVSVALTVKTPVVEILYTANSVTMNNGPGGVQAFGLVLVIDGVVNRTWNYAPDVTQNFVTPLSITWPVEGLSLASHTFLIRAFSLNSGSMSFNVPSAFGGGAVGTSAGALKVNGLWK